MADSASSDDETALLDDGRVEEFTEQSLFGGKIDSLEAHVARKEALADPFRYSVLYLVYQYGRVSRKLLAAETGRESNELQHHVRKLLRTNLIAEVPAPDDADGRQTFYRVTTLGRQEIRSDVEHIVGGEQHEIRFSRFDDIAFDGDTEGVGRKPAPEIVRDDESNGMDPEETRDRQRQLRKRSEQVDTAGEQS